MRIQLICGFLGAGKTTLLKNILKHETSDTVVLVNEFGEMGIDGTLISAGNNFNVVEMPSGCICCSLRESLVDAVREIMERYNPKTLIIEPSGIASPSSIILGLKKADFFDRIELAPVVGVIDLTFFVEVVRDGGINEVGDFFRDQILNSDITLLNKADLVTPADMEECRRAVAEVNPVTLIIPAVYCQVELPIVDVNQQTTHLHYTPRYNAESFVIPGQVDIGKVKSLLEEVKQEVYGEIFRAKGIIMTETGPRNFDYVNGQINFGQMDKAEENKFVFIGRQVDRSRLESAIRGCVD